MAVQKRGKKITLKGSYTKVKLVDINTIVPYDKNPKNHPQEQVKKIAGSIKQFGFDQPIVLDEENVIIKGHGRLLASKFLGLKRVPIIIRTDLSASQVRASRIADNQTAESYYDMGNLIYELETLYSLGGEESLNSTGFDETEIRTILPGLIDTEEEHIVQDLEGVIPIELSMTASDGLMGKRIKSKLSPEKYLKQHTGETIILFNGNKTDLASVCWAIQNGCDPKDLIVIDFTFGQRMWRWHEDYLDYISKELGITIQKSGTDDINKFKESIKEQGYPTEEKPYCCNVYKSRAISKNIKDPENALIIFGSTKTEDGVQTVRTKGKLITTNITYLAPFAADTPSKIIEVIDKSGISLNPLYKRLDSYLCPGCPYYKSPDYVMLKEEDLDLWIRWIVYMGRAQHHSESLKEGYLNKQLLRMIGDGIDARKTGTYADKALDFPECPQPMRDTIREGDDYGWDAEADKKLPDSGYIDKPRENWFEHEDFSKAYYALGEECNRVQEAINEQGYDAYMEKTVARAKEVALTMNVEEEAEEDFSDVKVKED